MRSVPPAPLTAPHGKSSLTGIFTRTTASVKAYISDTFTSLDNFVILADIFDTLTVFGGELGGYGAVRHKNQCATDNYKVSATVGTADNGKTRLVTCASPGFDRFYALEIENAVIDQFHIVKGTGLTWTTSSGIFGIARGLINLLLGPFSSFVLLLPWNSQPQAVITGDTVDIWWDQPNSTIRAYRNGVQVTSLAVDPEEIPHGDGFRYFGVMQGVTYGSPGVKFTSITARDVDSDEGGGGFTMTANFTADAHLTQTMGSALVNTMDLSGTATVAPGGVPPADDELPETLPTNL